MADIRRTDWQSHAQTGVSLLPLAMIAAVVVGYALRFVDPPTLWFDEAMLFVNIRDIAWHELFLPLPFYDQVAPIAYIALLKLIHSIAGLHEPSLRLPAWIALIATLALIARLPGTDRTTRILTAAMVSGSYVTARIATDAKPYMLEVLFAFAMMIAFHPVTRGIWTSTSFRIGLLSVAMLTTTAFPLVAFAVGAPFILAIARTDIAAQRKLGRWHCLRPVAIFITALALHIIYFATYQAPSLQLVAANHAYNFGAFGFAPDDTFYLSWFAYRWLTILVNHWLSGIPWLVVTSCLTVAIAVLAGAVALARRGSIYTAQAGTLLGFVAIANIAGYFPFLPGRFSIFMLPWLTLLAASGLAMATRMLPSATGQSIAISALTAVFIMPAVNKLNDPFREQARASLAHIRATPNVVLTTTFMGQPTLDAYLARARHGRSNCFISVAVGTTNRCTVARDATHGTFNAAATEWYLIHYIRVAGSGSDHGFPGASVDVLSSAYYDWIVTNLRRNTRTHLLFMGNNLMLSAVRAHLRPNESLIPIVDERPPRPPVVVVAARNCSSSKLTQLRELPAAARHQLQ